MMRSSGSQLTHDEKSQVFCADLMNLCDFARTIPIRKEREGTPTGRDSHRKRVMIPLHMEMGGTPGYS